MGTVNYTMMGLAGEDSGIFLSSWLWRKHSGPGKSFLSFNRAQGGSAKYFKVLMLLSFTSNPEKLPESTCVPYILLSLYSYRSGVIPTLLVPNKRRGAGDAGAASEESGRVWWRLRPTHQLPHDLCQRNCAAAWGRPAKNEGLNEWNYGLKELVMLR